MTTDAFTEAAEVASWEDDRHPDDTGAWSRMKFMRGARWARAHLAENGYGPMTTEKVREWTGAWPAEQRAEQPRALTADAIESVLHDILPLTTERLEGDDIADIAFDLHAALTEPPTRPETEDQT